IANGNYRGTYHGIPMALKDNLYIKNEVTTMSSKIHRDFVPTYDATVVERLRKAGAVFIGELNMHEYAWGATTSSPPFGTCHLPWCLGKIPVGASGGSAAAGITHMTMASLGTDRGASMRIPASICGMVGLKPTYGRVSNDGAFPFGWSLDHIGQMTT